MCVLFYQFLGCCRYPKNYAAATMAGALPPSLTPCPLPGYECAADLPGVTHSREKLEQSLEDFVASIALQDLPSSCVYTAISSEEETLGYRCSCAFQIVGLDAGRGEGSRLEYCMRNDFRAVPLGVDKFPGAQARHGHMARPSPIFVVFNRSPSPSSLQLPTRVYRRPWPESYRPCALSRRRIVVRHP